MKYLITVKVENETKTWSRVMTEEIESDSTSGPTELLERIEHEIEIQKDMDEGLF